MGKPIFAVGIPIPNGNFEWKSDGQGQSIWQPDGWSPSGLWLTESLNAAKMKTQWTTLRRGDTSYPYAPAHSTRGRAFGVSLSDTATISTTRTITSPPSPAGYLFGAEALDPFGTTRDYWWLRLRFWLRCYGNAPGAAAAWSVKVYGYNASESIITVLCNVALDGVADWAVPGWVQKVSTPFKLITDTHHIRAQLVCDRGVAGYSSASFSDISVETLGPVDAAGTVSSIEAINFTYAAEGIGGTYVQLQMPHMWSGYKVTPMRMGTGKRLPSGGYRWVDPSGGALRRRFTVPLANVPYRDYDALYRLWLCNKGQVQELASYYGGAFPILFSPQAVNDMGFYYVAFEGDSFPLEPDGAYQPGTEAGQRFRGVLSLVEV